MWTFLSSVLFTFIILLLFLYLSFSLLLCTLSFIILSSFSFNRNLFKFYYVSGIVQSAVKNLEKILHESSFKPFPIPLWEEEYS